MRLGPLFILIPSPHQLLLVHTHTHTHNMSWFFSSNSNGGHCGHCKGGVGTCACAICPQKGGSCCLHQHCPHCKGHASGCECKQGCAKLGYTQCRPVALSTTTGGVDHCLHCRGLQGSCACKEGCQKPSSAQCVSTSMAELGGLLGCVAQAACGHPASAISQPSSTSALRRQLVPGPVTMTTAA
jgi:hypothetical protein